MADLVIMGMEMPATCWNCKLKVGFSACGLVTDHKDGGFFYRVHEGNSRPDWCPLLPLPAGHGRLIDADVMVAEMEKQITERDKIMELCKRAGDMENYFRCSNNQTEIVSFVRMLNNAPTIVPAEGGEDDG